MKKKILLPILLFSCFVGAGLGSIADPTTLQVSFFGDLWDTIVDKPENKDESLFTSTLEGYRLPKETTEAFVELNNQRDADFATFIGAIILLGEAEEEVFIPGVILESDHGTFDQITELKRSLSMIKVGVDSLQDEHSAPIIRTTETDEVWAVVKQEEGGKEKTTDLLLEMKEIMRLGLRICTRQRTALLCL
jgi:hypothetical protein